MSTLSCQHNNQHLLQSITTVSPPMNAFSTSSSSSNNNSTNKLDSQQQLQQSQSSITNIMEDSSSSTRTVGSDSNNSNSLPKSSYHSDNLMPLTNSTFLSPYPSPLNCYNSPTHKQQQQLHPFSSPSSCNNNNVTSGVIPSTAPTAPYCPAVIPNNNDCYNNFYSPMGNNNNNGGFSTYSSSYPPPPPHPHHSLPPHPHHPSLPLSSIPTDQQNSYPRQSDYNNGMTYSGQTNNNNNNNNNNAQRAYPNYQDFMSNYLGHHGLVGRNLPTSTLPLPPYYDNSTAMPPQISPTTNQFMSSPYTVHSSTHLQQQQQQQHGNSFLTSLHSNLTSKDPLMNNQSLKPNDNHSRMQTFDNNTLSTIIHTTTGGGGGPGAVGAATVGQQQQHQRKCNGNIIVTSPTCTSSSPHSIYQPGFVTLAEADTSNITGTQHSSMSASSDHSSARKWDSNQDSKSTQRQRKQSRKPAPRLGEGRRDLKNDSSVSKQFLASPESRAKQADRRKRNRESAQRCRARKNATLETLGKKREKMHQKLERKLRILLSSLEKNTLMCDALCCFPIASYASQSNELVQKVTVNIQESMHLSEFQDTKEILMETLKHLENSTHRSSSSSNTTNTTAATITTTTTNNNNNNNNNNIGTTITGLAGTLGGGGSGGSGSTVPTMTSMDHHYNNNKAYSSSSRGFRCDGLASLLNC